ncbi:hypothetical protein KXV95_008423 [Aspergillus fumigatus]|nr:hypothetical protein KXX51_002485 [Aspergillus fumigatus]KAH1759332.1 hypothetical protein KXX41_005952 [Aspergillus fumigatus]KAH2234253.1 hypothetical protein KXW71_006723 [Aspergillus fumigatus]KAH2285507.1 hypothetical protein KXV50_008745 [Aspergillus fumigatus]KAH3420955.1 hypothetical protein KXW09_002082 [Aspergillus fumigatus]
MSRAIDRLAEPAEKKKKKVIVASSSRTGTLGLYFAMKILGYTPYHMYEVALVQGTPGMAALLEAVIAEHNRLSGIKRFDKGDLDKLTADYDCLIEIPSFLGPALLDEYAQDPEVKIILTERDPDRWAKSVNGTAGFVVKAAASFPLNVLKHFDEELGIFLALNTTVYAVVADSTKPGQPGNEAALRRNYVEYIKAVKNTVPKDRLLVIKLEDGLGWEQICPFLGVPIPEEKYPRGNDADNFKGLVENYFRERTRAAMVRGPILIIPSLNRIALEFELCKMATGHDSLILRYSGLELPDEQSFYKHLVSKNFEVRATKDVFYAELVYDNIAPAWMENVRETLERTRAGFCKSYNTLTLILRVVAMASLLHNVDQVWCHQCEIQWLVFAQLTQILTPEVYEFPDGQFAGLQKAPNVAINVPNAIMPIIVVESGWSGSLDRLREDADEWLVGGNGAVQAAVIINWTANRTTRRIRGVVELYTLDKSGMPRLQQREKQIFPVPPGIQPGNQTITLTRRMIFSQSARPGADPGDILPLDIDRLRTIAQIGMEKMGYSPA